MTPEEYFANNVDSILITAEFVAKRRNLDSNIVLEEIKKEFINKNGTKHKTHIFVDGKSFDLSFYLTELRDLSIERLIIFLVYNNKLYKIYCSDGNQFSSSFSDGEIINAVTAVKLKLMVEKKISFFVCHNHPYVYGANPSLEDLNSIDNLKSIAKNMNMLDPFTTVEFVDFGIVTKFDYRSYEQANTF